MIDGLTIARQAREWLGTPYGHQQRMRGVLVDCAGLVIGVARELGLIAPEFDITAYPRSPDGKSLLEHCNQWMTRIAKNEMQPGDVIVIRWAKDPQHLGIVGDYVHGGLSMIHAYSDGSSHGKVIEHHLGPAHLARFVASYRMPGIA